MATVVLEMSSSPRVAVTPAERVVCAWLLGTWLAFRTAIWTGLAALTQPNAPLDLIEWLAWGREWQWGYHKHPPLPAWIAELSFRLAGGQVWGVYLAGYLCSAACLWCVWRLGCAVTTPRRALLAAAALEGLIFLGYDAAEFGNNVVLNAAWALTILCGYHAARTRQYRWWLLTGLTLGAGLLCKYTLVFVLPPLALFLLWRPETRTRRTLLGVGLAAAAAFVVFLPHLVWVARNEFVTVAYALERSASEEKAWWSHFKNPLLFALSQLGRLLPVLLILTPLTGWRWRRRRAGAAGRFDRDYLLAAVAGPAVLLLLTSLATGMQLREIWGSPLWTYAPLLLLVALRTDDSPAAWRRAGWVAGATALAFLAFALAKNYGEPRWGGRLYRVHFPGKQLAEEASRRYAERVGERCPVAVGESWLAGNVSCYAPQRPRTYCSGEMGRCTLDPKAAPWLTEDEIRRLGAVLLWDAGQFGDGLPPEMRARFPEARTQPPILLPYPGLPHVPPARVGLALQPPAR